MERKNKLLHVDTFEFDGDNVSLDEFLSMLKKFQGNVFIGGLFCYECSGGIDIYVEETEEERKKREFLEAKDIKDKELKKKERRRRKYEELKKEFE